MHGLVRLAVVSLWFPLWALGAEPIERNLRMVKGTESVLEVNGMTRISVGDPAVLAVRPLEGHQLLLTALKKGNTTLLVWRGNAHRDAYTVSVVDEALAGLDPNGPAVPLASVGSSAEAGTTSIDLGAGLQKVLTFSSIQRVAIGDPDVCDVKTIGNNQLLLVGMHPGVTTLLVWKAGGERVEYTIHVRGGR